MKSKTLIKCIYGFSMEDLSRLNTFKWDLTVDEMYEKEKKILRRALELLLEMYRHREECTIQNVLKYRDRLFRQFKIREEYGVKIPKKLRRTMLSELDKELFHLDDMVIPGYEPRPAPAFTIGGVEVPESVGQKRERRGRKKNGDHHTSALEDFHFLINYVETAQMAAEAESDRLMELEREKMKKGRGRPEGAENKKGRKHKKKTPVVKSTEETATSGAIILGQGDEVQTAPKSSGDSEVIHINPMNTVVGEGHEVSGNGEKKRGGRKLGSTNIAATHATNRDVIIVDEEIVVRKFPTYFEQYLFQYTRKNRSIGSAQWCDHAYSELEKIMRSMKSSVDKYISKWEEINTDEVYWLKKFLLFQTKFNLTPTLEGYDRDWVDDVVEGGDVLNRNGLNKQTIDTYKTFLEHIGNESISVYINALISDEYAEETLYATANKRDKVAPRKKFKRSEHIPTAPNVVYLPPVEGMKETSRNQIISVVNGIPIPSEYNIKPTTKITEEVIKSIENIPNDIPAFPPKRLTKKPVMFKGAKRVKNNVVTEESEDENNCNYILINESAISSRFISSFSTSKAPAVISSKPVERYIPFADDPIYSYKPIISSSSKYSRSAQAPVNEKKINPLATFIHNGRSITFKDGVLESNMFKRPNNVVKKEIPYIPIKSDIIMNKFLVNKPKPFNVPIFNKSAGPFVPKSIIDVEPIRLVNPIKSVNSANVSVNPMVNIPKITVVKPIINTVIKPSYVPKLFVSEPKINKSIDVSNVAKLSNDLKSSSIVKPTPTVKPSNVSNVTRLLNELKSAPTDRLTPIIKSVDNCETRNYMNDVVEIPVPIRISSALNNTCEVKHDEYNESDNTVYYGVPADFHGFDYDCDYNIDNISKTDGSDFEDLINFDEELCTESSDSDNHIELTNTVEIPHMKDDKSINCDISSSDSDSENGKNIFNLIGNISNSDSDTDSNTNINLMDTPIVFDEISDNTSILEPTSDVESNNNVVNFEQDLYSESESESESDDESEIIGNTHSFAGLLNFDGIMMSRINPEINKNTSEDLITFDEITTIETNSVENENVDMFGDLISFDEAIIPTVTVNNISDLYEENITNNDLQYSTNELNLMNIGNEIRNNLMTNETEIFDVVNSPIDDLIKYYTRNFNSLHTFTL